MPAVSFIRFKLKEGFDLNTVVSYYAAVIQEGISVEEWRRSIQKPFVKFVHNQRGLDI